MLRTFSYKFDPAAACPIKGNTAELATDEIESAGLLEVLQTPGASLSSWAFLGALLEQTGPGTPFVFKEPLGQAREVKVALSGLFGRFVARAYLQRYFNLAIFAHLGRRSFRLDGRLRIRVSRKKKQRGDLPDWIASDAGLTRLFVAEAKGCHDRSGADQALARAWAQANRIDVILRRGKAQRKAQVKRIAIATRWGVAAGGPAIPIIAVKDPDEAGDMSPDEISAALVGIARHHVANLLKGIGYVESSTCSGGIDRCSNPQCRQRHIADRSEGITGHGHASCNGCSTIWINRPPCWALGHASRTSERRPSLRK